jgi:TetR/AcrR family transcriptional regulator
MGETAGKLDEKIRVRNIRLILKAATEVFSRKGFDGTRISEIAETAKLPKANIYYYFSSKDEIYSAIIAQLIAGWDDALSNITPQREPADALGGYIRAKLDYSRRYPEESRLFANEIIHGARFLSPRDRAHMAIVTNKYVSIVEGWMTQGKLAPVDPRHLFIMLWSMTQFYADFGLLAADALGRKKLKSEDFEHAAETIIQTVMAGLLPRHPA